MTAVRSATEGEDAAVDGLRMRMEKKHFDEVEPRAAGRGEAQLDAGWRVSQALTVACLWMA